MKKKIYFANLCIQRGKDNFGKPSIAEAVLRELGNWGSRENGKELYCYCLMPHELQILFSLSESSEREASDWIGIFKRKISRKINTLFGIKLTWNKDGKHHVMNNENDISETVKNILEAPVHGGLVEEPGDFRYSRLIKKP